MNDENIEKEGMKQVQTGYHRREIPKGELGEFSKITEEFTELYDAVEQQNSVLELFKNFKRAGRL